MPDKHTFIPFSRIGLSAATESPYTDCFNTKERIKEASAMESVLKTQIGGAHYKDNAIQPIEFISSNNLGFIAGSVIKYTVRADKKGGLEDWKKIIHYAQIELETKYGVKSEVRYEEKPVGFTAKVGGNSDKGFFVRTDEKPNLQLPLEGGKKYKLSTGATGEAEIHEGWDNQGIVEYACIAGWHQRTDSGKNLYDPDKVVVVEGPL